MSLLSSLSRGSTIVSRSDLCVDLKQEFHTLGYEVRKDAELYEYRFGLFTEEGVLRDDLVRFYSSGIHEDIFKELVKIVKRAQPESLVSTYRSATREDLRDFIETLPGHDEVSAFSLLLHVNDSGFFSTDEERHFLATAHVEKWEGKALNEFQKKQYFSPVLDQWEVDTFKSLYSCGVGRESALKGCPDREFRRLYNFLSILSSRGISKDKLSRTVKELVDELPERDISLHEGRAANYRFPIHHEEYRDFILGLKIEELEYLNCVFIMPPDGVSPQGAVRISNMNLELSRARGSDWWPTPPILAELIEKVPEINETLLSRDPVSHLTFQAFVASTPISLMFHDLLGSKSGSFEQTKKAVFDFESFSGSLDKIYIVERLLEATGSSDKVLEILKSVRQSDDVVTLPAWEEYAANWDSFKDLDPVMTLQILESP